MPMKIDTETLSTENVIFARILVDIDLAKALLKDLNFFLSTALEKLLELCNRCGSVGHGFNEY